MTVDISNLAIGDYVYRLTVTDNANVSATDTVKVTVIDNFRNYDQPFALYPNPATDIINIRFLSDKAERSELSVYDMAGKMVIAPMVINKPTGAFTVTVNITTLKPGTYVVQVGSFGRKKMTAKFIKL
jgi:hypothetical protein